MEGYVPDGVLLGFDEIAADLVVEELNGLPLDLLSGVLLLFLFQGQVDENLLELLIDVVDAKLLEAIDVENLETVDIENTEDVEVAGGPTEGLVDSHDDVVEESGVHGLGESVSGVDGAESILRHGVGGSARTAATSTGLNGSRAKSLSEELRLGLHEPSAQLQTVVVDDVRRLVFLVELDVSEPQDGRQNSKDFVLLLWDETHRVHRVHHVLELRAIVHAVYREATALVQVEVRFCARQTEFFSHLIICACQQHIEDVESALIIVLIHYA